jgi:hypothetical protein
MGVGSGLAAAKGEMAAIMPKATATNSLCAMSFLLER